jgi:CheY-like chemotaxis protein
MLPTKPLRWETRTVVRPTLFAVDDDSQALAVFEYALRRRYGADYEVVTEASAPAGLARLRLLRERGEDVALMVADQRMPEMTGIDFLTDQVPRSQRVGGVSGARARRLAPEPGPRSMRP